MSKTEPTKQPKERKEWRSPDGSIFRRELTRRTKTGGTRKEIVFEARKRYWKPVLDAAGNPAFGDDGKPLLKLTDKTARCKTHAEATAALARLKAEVQNELHAVANRKEKTLFELIEYYRENYSQPAKYVNETKVSGLREPQRLIEYNLKRYQDFFGNCPLSAITYAELKRFKKARTETQVSRVHNRKVPLTEAEKLKARNPRQEYRIVKETVKTDRAAATVHRELSRLRRLLSIAVQHGWLDSNPFHKGDSLISQSIEVERLRILSFAEEKRLLEACRSEELRHHLIPLIICAVDTGMRKGEIFLMEWKQIDLTKKFIRIPILSTKILRWRMVPISFRLKIELEKLAENKDYDASSEAPVFPLGDVKRAWTSAREKAALADFRFHDLRATAITRMLESGRSPAEVMKISGHSQFKTFLRYVRQDSENAQRAGDALDDYLKNHL